MYAAAMKAVPPAERKVKEPRWRVEHAQIVAPADLPRFKQLGLIASMQPSHAIGDLFFAPEPARARRASRARTRGRPFFKLGVPVAGGTDAPVERGEPMIEFYAAVARKSLDGRSAPDWHPEETSHPRTGAEDVHAGFRRLPRSRKSATARWWSARRPISRSSIRTS